MFYVAFLDLSSCRINTNGIGAIPWWVIDRYCVANEIYNDQREDVFYHVTRLDKVFTDHFAEKQKRELATHQTKSKRPTKKR